MGDISRLLDAWRAGNAAAAEEVVSRTYAELHHIAHAHMRGERRGHLLQTTALLHEAYLRLLRNGPASVESRDAFLRLMSAEMRRRLIDQARRRMAKKRGPHAVREGVDASISANAEDASDVEAQLARLDRALEELHKLFPRPAQVVQLRFIARFTEEETARELKLSVGTVKRDWTFARAWLATALTD